MKKLIFTLALIGILGSVSWGGLVTKLEFNGNITDSTGNITYTGNHGAYIAGPSGFGQAMKLDKASQNVVYAEGVGAALSTITSKITVAFWQYGANSLPSTGDPTIIFSANTQGTSQDAWSRISVQLPYDAANVYSFFDTWGPGEIGGTDRLYKYMGNDLTLFKGSWVHWAYIKDTTLDDSSSANARMKVYRNGVLWNNSYTDGYGGGVGMKSLAGMNDLYIGAEKQYWYFYDGAIDDFRLYDTALSQGDVQNLMIPEPIATNPNPSTQATNISTTATLSWYSDSQVSTHDVYLGTNYNSVMNAGPNSVEFKGTQGTTTYIPANPLLFGTQYFWRVDEITNLGTVKGDVWSFATISKASNPVPVDGSQNRPVSSVLRWTSGSYATSHHLFLGTNFSEVNEATVSSNVFVGNLPAATYDPPGLFEKGTTYYWRVDEVNDTYIQKGVVWSFTTSADYGTLTLTSGPNTVEITNSIQKVFVGKKLLSDLLVSGKFSNAVAFAGNDKNKLTIPYITEFNATQRTIEFWARLSPKSIIQVMVSRGAKAANHWEVYANASGNLSYYIKTTSNNTKESSVYITDNQWHFVSFRIDTSSKQASLAVDGVVATSGTYSGSFTTSTQPITVGSLPSGESYAIRYPIVGVIDDLRLSKSWHSSISIPGSAMTADSNTIGLYCLDAVVSNSFDDASAKNNDTSSLTFSEYTVTTYAKNGQTWELFFDGRRPIMEGLSFNLEPSSLAVVDNNSSKKSVRLSGTHPNYGYSWNVLIEANSGSPLIKFLVTCHLASNLSIAAGPEPTVALWINQPADEVIVEQGPMSIYGDYGASFPAAYVWTQGKEAIVFFNMTPMTWMGPGNIKRFIDCRVKSISQNNQLGIGLYPYSKSGNSIPSGDMAVEFYLYSCWRQNQPTKLQGMDTMVEVCAPLHGATSPFPSNRIAPYELSWKVFAGKAIDELMLQNTTYYSEYSGWNDDPLHIVNPVNYIRTHPARPYDTGWDFSTVNNHLSPWILYTRLNADPTKREFAMAKKNDLPLFYDDSSKMILWGTRYPAHVGDISMSWQDFFYYIETLRNHRVLAADDFNPAIAGRFLMGTEGLIEYAHNVNYVFSQFFNSATKQAVAQQDIPALGDIREPWQAGSYSLIMLYAYELTSDENYLQEAQTSIDTLLNTMTFTVSNNYYNIQYTNPVDFPITELFGNAYGAVAAYRIYELTGNTKYIQYSKDFMNSLLRLTFWYEDETDVYSRDLKNLGLFHPHGGAFNTCPWENSEAHIVLTWLLKHYPDLPVTELLLKLTNLNRINSYYYFPATYTDIVRSLGVDDSVNPYHPIEPFYSMEAGGHSGAPACYMAGAGMWNYWMYEALAAADNRDIMVLNLDVMEDYEYAMSSAERHFIVFNPTTQNVNFSFISTALADGNYTVSIHDNAPNTADLNADGYVDFKDFAILAAQWLQPPGQPSADIAPDGNPNGIVDMSDVALFSDNWLNVKNDFNGNYSKTQLQSGIGLTLRPMDYATITIKHENGTNLRTGIDLWKNAQNKLAYAYELMQTRQRDHGDVSQTLIDVFNAAMNDYTNHDYNYAMTKAQSIIDSLL